MSQEPGQTVDAVIFFDECAAKLEKCTRDCEFNTNVICKHRLVFNGHVLYGSELIPGASDFKVILRFIHMIKRHKLGVSISGSTKFVLLTKDLRFLKSVAKQAKTKKHPLKINRQLKTVVYESVSVSVLFSRCDRCQAGTYSDLKCMVRELNGHFS